MTTWFRCPHIRRVPWRGVLLISGLALATPGVTAQDLTQRQAIAAIIRELDYLIAHSEQLAHRHAGDRAPIRFNYGAFLAQLRTTRERASAYLNETHQTVLTSPPAPVTDSLTVRR